MLFLISLLFWDPSVLIRFLLLFCWCQVFVRVRDEALPSWEGFFFKAGSMKGSHFHKLAAVRRFIHHNSNVSNRWLRCIVWPSNTSVKKRIKGWSLSVRDGIWNLSLYEFTLCSTFFRPSLLIVNQSRIPVGVRTIMKSHWILGEVLEKSICSYRRVARRIEVLRCSSFADSSSPKQKHSWNEALGRTTHKGYSE